MSHTPDGPRSRLFPRRVLAATGLLLAGLVATAPADVVIMKDGFIIQGNVRKEMETVHDKATGQAFSVPRGNGFDMVVDGPRVVIFSSHHRQLGEIGKDVKIRPEYKAYTNKIENRKSNHPLPALGGAVASPDFNDRWKRVLQVRVPGGIDRIEQQVTYLDPYCCFIVSPTHLWSQTYRTAEMDPKKVRKLLSTHPELAEPDGKPDPIKRIAIARFMKDAGWLYLAKEEVANLKRAVPGPFAKEAQEQFDKLQKDIDQATAELVVNELELVLNAGRYRYASELVTVFPDKTADPKDVARFTSLKAQLETSRDQFEAGRRLLRDLVDSVAGGGPRAAAAVGGGPLAAVWPSQSGADPQLAALASAAETVLGELHPDSAGRIEFFVAFGLQAEREKKQGREASKKPEELLATAISGWVKGKNGATPRPDLALRIWAAREAVLAYQRAPIINERHAVLARYRSNKPIELDEMAQVISLLPPAEPEDLSARTGKPVRSGGGVPEGVYQRKTQPYNQHPAGVDYLVKLPPEYHHGRAYPVLIVLTYPGLDAERLLGAVAGDADKRGYILVAPLWTAAFDGKGVWEWKGEDHDFVLASLRDVIRHLTVDNDRVFMIGAGEGADMAMDVGASHPDLFAGVVAMGPAPKWQGLFIDYWKNAQKLPFYVVTGELANDSYTNTRRIFDRWMPNGFPGLGVVYKGRGVEWFSAELPEIFDWLGRKKRANGTSTLQLGGGPRFPWQTSRVSDNRFYWLGAEKINPANLAENVSPGRSVITAELLGDIRGNNRIELRTRGVRTVSVWLGRDMIDWTKPVYVRLNNAIPNGWKAKVLTPDMEVLLEDYWHRGDRRMLYLAKLEFPGH